MPSMWLWGGFGWLCPAFRDWMLDVRRSMSDVPDREPSRFAAGMNGLGGWTFWRLLALVAAANRDGSRSDPELDAALPRWVPSRNTLGFSASRPNLLLILVRVQVETNNPGPCTDAPHPVLVRSQPWQARFQGSYHPGHV